MSAAVVRLVARTTNMAPRRPDPPRQLRYESTSRRLTWLPPANSRHITHYRVYLDQDGSAPTYEVSAGQNSVSTPKTGRYYVSAYNATTRLESAKIGVNVTVPGQSTVDDGYYEIPYAAEITPELSHGLNQRLVMTGDCDISVPLLNGGTPPAGCWFELEIDCGGFVPTFASDYEASKVTLDNTAGVFTTLVHTMRADGTWKFSSPPVNHV